MFIFMENFEKIQAEIDADATEFYKSAEDLYLEPIFDGILDFNGYSNAKVKILWILKEPYDSFDDEGKPCGGGWKLSGLLDRNPDQFIRKQPTWNTIAYTSYSVINNVPFSDIFHDVSWEDLQNVLRSISVINISKLPGLPKSDDNHISELFIQNKDLILKQLKGYSPDIIIGGNTIKHFKKDGYFNGFNFDESDTQHYYNEKQLFIDAYHPSRCGNWPKKDYVNRINQVAQKWLQKFPR